jgi:nucleoside-diphosphate-sugar epimerase
MKNLAESCTRHFTTSLPCCCCCCCTSQVELLEGDLNSDDLGLSQRELSLVQNNVNILIHSAASIQLEADVQHTLRSNYLGTRRLLALATQMQQLRAMVHVSTAYVNVNFPRGSTVDERIFPLYFGQQEVHHADIVDDLMSLKPAAANVRVRGLLFVLCLCLLLIR